MVQVMHEYNKNGTVICKYISSPVHIRIIIFLFSFASLSIVLLSTNRRYV